MTSPYRTHYIRPLRSPRDVPRRALASAALLAAVTACQSAPTTDAAADPSNTDTSSPSPTSDAPDPSLLMEGACTLAFGLDEGFSRYNGVATWESHTDDHFQLHCQTSGNGSYTVYGYNLATQPTVGDTPVEPTRDDGLQAYYTTHPPGFGQGEIHNATDGTLTITSLDGTILRGYAVFPARYEPSDGAPQEVDIVGAFAARRSN